MKTRVLRRTDTAGTVRFEVQRFDEADKVQPWKLCYSHGSSDAAIGHAFRLATPEHIVAEFGQ